MVKKKIISKIKEYQPYIAKLFCSENYTFNERKLSELPNRAGVYRIFKKVNPDKTLYVGRSKNLRRRILNNHFLWIGRSILRRKIERKLFGDKEKTLTRKQMEERITRYLINNYYVKVVPIDEEKLRINFVEHFAIAIFRPELND